MTGGTTATRNSLCHSDVIPACGRSAFGRTHKVDYALEIVDRSELHDDLALAFAKADGHACIERRRQSFSNVLQSWHVYWLASRRGRRRGALAIRQCDRFFGGTHRQSLGDDARRQLLLLFWTTLEGQQ